MAQALGYVLSASQRSSRIRFLMSFLYFCCGIARATINSQSVRVTVTTMSARPGFRRSDTAAGYELWDLCNGHLLFHQSPNARPIFCSLLRRDKVQGDRNEYLDS